ncbi:MAG: STAUR_1299 family protein [Myxococcales bacterium]
MEERLRELLADAFREVPAREANQAISRARRERAGGDPDDDEGPSFRSYELVLSTWETFVREQLPKLVYHLESVGAHLPECRGVMVSAFVGERLLFLDAKALVARICTMLSVTAEQLVDSHGTGERRTAIREPLLLPGPKGRN